KVTTEAKSDFADAVKFFQDTDKSGTWNATTCGQAAANFEGVASQHDKIVEAFFNAGVAWQKCGDTKKAEDEYKKALAINASHAPSLANLGEIYYKGGNEAVGEQYFQKAVQADPKITAARNNLAWIAYTRMRKNNDVKAGDDALGQLSRVLAVD